VYFREQVRQIVLLQLYAKEPLSKYAFVLVVANGDNIRFNYEFEPVAFSDGGYIFIFIHSYSR